MTSDHGIASSNKHSIESYDLELSMFQRVALDEDFDDPNDRYLSQFRAQLVLAAEEAADRITVGGASGFYVALANAWVAGVRPVEVFDSESESMLQAYEALEASGRDFSTLELIVLEALAVHRDYRGLDLELHLVRQIVRTAPGSLSLVVFPRWLGRGREAGPEDFLPWSRLGAVPLADSNFLALDVELRNPAIDEGCW